MVSSVFAILDVIEEEEPRHKCAGHMLVHRTMRLGLLWRVEQCPQGNDLPRRSIHRQYGKDFPGCPFVEGVLHAVPQ